MKLWFQCWDYINYEESPNSVHTKGDLGIMRCSHVSHSHGDEATLELQHQRDNVWFDRATDPTRPDQPNMSSGDAIISCSNFQHVYSAPTIAHVRRIDARRVVLDYSDKLDLPYTIQGLNFKNVSWVIDTILSKKGVGFPREDRTDFLSARAPEPKYIVDPIVNMRRGSGVVMVDARKTSKPWQLAYMNEKVESRKQDIYDACVDTPVEGRTNIFFIASGLHCTNHEISKIRKQLISSIGIVLQDESNISLGKIDCCVWTSWELAYQVRAYPDMMAHLVQTMFAETGHRKAD